MNVNERVYFEKLITRLIYYITWVFVVLVIVIAFEYIRMTFSTSGIGSLMKIPEGMIDLIRENFEFVWITSVILLIIIGLLFSGYNYELVKEIYLSRDKGNECFVNPVSKTAMVEKLEIYISHLVVAKDYASDYGLSEKLLTDTIQHSVELKSNILNMPQEYFNINEVYTLMMPLLNLYYLQNKTAQQLSKDLDIPIVVPNENLEDEYRTRYERLFTTGINRQLFPGGKPPY
jgi:hypothetical protein